MQEIEYHEGQRLRDTHICGQCGAPLLVAWGGFYGIDGHILRCGDNPDHNGIVPKMTYSRAYKQGYALPTYMENKLEKKLGRRTMNEKGSQVALLNEAQKGHIKKHLEATFAGNLVPTEAAKAFALVEKGFDPYFHLCLYQGKVTLTIDGWYWWAKGDNTFGGVISDPITDPSLKEAYGIGENEIGALAKLYRKGDEHPALVGFGRASKDEKLPVIRGSFVEHLHPYRMAEKRAEAQALRKFRTIGVDVRAPEELMQGDVIDGEARVLEDELPPPPGPAPTPGGAPPGPAPTPTEGGLWEDEDEDIEPDLPKAPRAAQTATEAQIKAIHAILGRLNADPELYHADLKARFDVDSTKDLTKAQASTVIDNLQKRQEGLA